MAIFAGLTWMRRWVIWLCAPVFAVQAGQLAAHRQRDRLDAALGLFEQLVIQELSTRHFADTVDEAKEKRSSKAGASAELIAALKSGIIHFRRKRRPRCKNK